MQVICHTSAEDLGPDLPGVARRLSAWSVGNDAGAALPDGVVRR
jgi:hypothetical protein